MRRAAGPARLKATCPRVGVERSADILAWRPRSRPRHGPRSSRRETSPSARAHVRARRGASSAGAALDTQVLVETMIRARSRPCAGEVRPSRPGAMDVRCKALLRGQCTGRRRGDPGARCSRRQASGTATPAAARLNRRLQGRGGGWRLRSGWVTASDAPPPRRRAFRRSDDRGDRRHPTISASERGVRRALLGGARSAAWRFDERNENAGEREQLIESLYSSRTPARRQPHATVMRRRRRLSAPAPLAKRAIRSRSSTTAASIGRASIAAGFGYRSAPADKADTVAQRPRRGARK